MSDNGTDFYEWSNFETWKVNRQILDCWTVFYVMDTAEVEEIMDSKNENDHRDVIATIAKYLEKYVYDMVFNGPHIPDGYAKTFANDFLDAVNFDELARSKVEKAFEEVRHARSCTKKMWR